MKLVQSTSKSEVRAENALLTDHVLDSVQLNGSSGNIQQNLVEISGSILDTAEVAVLVEGGLQNLEAQINELTPKASLRAKKATGVEFEFNYSNLLNSTFHLKLIRCLGALAADEVIRWNAARGGVRNVSGLEKVAALASLSKRMEGYPQLSAKAQNEVVVLYQLSVAAKKDILLLKTKAAKSTSRPVIKGYNKKIYLLERVVEDGEVALEYLLGSNFRLVLLIAGEVTRARYGRENATKLMGDVVAEAVAGFYEAALEFDEERCDAFHTYAARLIRERVRMSLGKESAIRLVPSWGRVKRIAVARIPELTTALGRAPTTPEIQEELLRICLEWANSKLTAAELNLDEEGRRLACMARLRKQGMLGAIASIEAVLVISGPVASLDAPVGGDGGSTLGSLISGNVDNTAIDNVEREELSKALLEGLALLSERERVILMTRYGMIGDGEINFRELGERFDVSAERVRQIEKSALLKMAPEGSVIYEKLKAFLPSFSE